MRKILNTILVIGTMIFASCENYEENERLIPIIGETDLTTPITKQQSKQAILVEDFTAWNCPNCPKGTEALEAEMGKYGDRLVVSAVHTGRLASPTHENNNLDFRTPYGDELKQTFKVQDQIGYGGANVRIYGSNGKVQVRANGKTSVYGNVCFAI